MALLRPFTPFYSSITDGGHCGILLACRFSRVDLIRNVELEFAFNLKEFGEFREEITKCKKDLSSSKGKTGDI